LHLGSSAEKANDDSNTFTIGGFEAVLRTLKTMEKLIVLDMQLPHVKKLNIYSKSKHSLLNLGVDDRGTQFIA
jgi:hypothetical protein